MQASILIEIEWEFGEDEERDPNWLYCVQEATFKHDEACEFILHIERDQEEFPIEGQLHLMRDAGCTPEFVQAYLDAFNLGAQRVLFWS
jgi:hypothetical protein